MTAQNDADGRVQRRHRDNLKKNSYTFRIKINIPDHNSSMEDLGHSENSNFENYENIARQIYDEYNDFNDKLLFQGDPSNATEVETAVNYIRVSIENLLLDTPPNVKLNPQYHDKDISIDFDKW